MKKDWKYILYISLAFGLFVAVKLLSPKQYDWSVTFAHDDKNPYGAYALHELLGTIFPENEINHSYKTIYEIKDSLMQESNLMIVCSSFSGGKEDTEALLKHVAAGGSVMISAQYFYGHFMDTLKVETYDYFFKEGDVFTKADSSVLRITNPSIDTMQRYTFRRDNTHHYFSKFDSTKTTVIARNDRDLPVTIRIKWGKGNLILNSTPLAFTNIYLLAHENHNFISSTLSFLPQKDLQWTEFYQVGRMEARTPLRFILTHEPLAWAYYVTIISLLVFMIFEMKRRQRIIPVINPLANTTLQFVTTIGNLYYQNKEHKSIAEKKIAFFLEHIRTKYFLNTNKIDDIFITALSKKSGKSKEDVLSLFNIIHEVQRQDKISAALLTSLNSKIEEFNKL